jgi:hypothetical protein
MRVAERLRLHGFFKYTFNRHGHDRSEQPQ